MRTLTFWLLLSAAAHSQSAGMPIAVAANFRDTFEVLSRRFEAESGIDLRPTFGASGMLATQISSGAPFAAFLSADVERPAMLDAQGLTVPGSHFVYAIGSLALWVPAGAAPNAAWLRAANHRLAIANPLLAPYGRAARQVLEALGVATDDKRIVIGTSIAQVAHFVSTGATSGGLLARAQAIAIGAPTDRVWLVPDELHAPIEQAAVALLGPFQRDAQRLLDFIQTDEARATIVAHGYTVLSR